MKTVVVTGCSSGAGRAAALLLAREGWRVFAVVRQQSDADALEAEGSGGLEALLADVTSRAEVFDAAKRVADAAGGHGLDGLICNAGVGGGGPLEFATQDDLARPIETNLYGSIYCAQAFMPLLRSARGRIINITSGSTLFNMPLVSTYPAAKYALELVTRQLRCEVEQFGIKVILVDPGQIKTRMTQEAGEQSREVREKLPPMAVELYGEMIDGLENAAAGMKGSGKEPEEVAKVYLRALTDAKPKPFYAVGLDAKFMRVLSHVAPQRFIDAMAARAMSR
jgi:NAD(P)-dependent dehydrogenase (short-subunit alcohol dehydrogenase family)